MAFFRAATLAALISLSPVSGAAWASAGLPMADTPMNNYVALSFAKDACASRFRVDERHLESYFQARVMPVWNQATNEMSDADAATGSAYKAMGQEAFCSAVYDLFNLATGTRAPKAIRAL